MMIREFRPIAMTDTMAETKLCSLADICLGGKSYRSEHHGFGNDPRAVGENGNGSKEITIAFFRLPQTYREIVRQFETRLSFEPPGA